MAKIDIDAVLAAKAPKAARWIPKFITRWLKRTVHQDEINYILSEYGSLPPQQFIQACFKFWGVTYSVEGMERLDPHGRYLFASNHPFGGMDGMMLADELIEYFGDVRVIVNDLLMHVEPLRPLWIPVNKHGSQSAENLRRFDEAFAGELPILSFPAGLCSRRQNGVVSDPVWRTNFVKRAAAFDRQIVPMFVEGHLSDFFYRLSNLRKRLGIKFNVEMLYLPDEMFSQKGNHFRILVDDPIPAEALARQGGWRQQTDYVREKVYTLQKKLELECKRG